MSQRNHIAGWSLTEDLKYRPATVALVGVTRAGRSFRCSNRCRRRSSPPAGFGITDSVLGLRRETVRGAQVCAAKLEQEEPELAMRDAKGSGAETFCPARRREEEKDV